MSFQKNLNKIILTHHKSKYFSKKELIKKRLQNYRLSNNKFYKKVELNSNYFEEICSEEFLNSFKKIIKKSNKIYFSKYKK